MNIQKRKKNIKIMFPILCVFYLSVSCQTNKKNNIVRTIAKGVIIQNEKYYFSDEADIAIGKRKYSLRSKIKYDTKGNLLNLFVYHPEGVLEYTREDLLSDKKLLTGYGYSFRYEYTFDNNKKLFNSLGKEVLTEKLGENTLCTKSKNRVTLYYLK